ncbi:MAG: hypothetical protein NZ480_03195 [Bdellovibrionaceae bacterium]|nr:hypothetical protein [Pseudobdellovibrionaceae bacterium]MDW8189921.1 hypothetical protein [Pseudobdellovibrionaceae bacterium]
MMALKNSFFSWIQEYLANNEKAVLFYLDLGWPSVLDVKRKYPQRVINCGVTETNTLLVAIGLASQGFKVFIYGISQFTLWRPAEIFNLYGKNLKNIAIIGNGGGFGYGILGSSHHSIKDYGLLQLSGISATIFLPRSQDELLYQLNLFGQQNENTFCYYRLINVNESKVKIHPIDSINQHRSGNKATVLSIGPLIQDHFDPELNVDWFSLGRWPLEENQLKPIERSACKTGKLIIFEEHVWPGSICQFLNHLWRHKNFAIITAHPSHYENLVGNRSYLLEQAGLDIKALKNYV